MIKLCNVNKMCMVGIKIRMILILEFFIDDGFACLFRLRPTRDLCLNNVSYLRMGNLRFVFA